MLKFLMMMLIMIMSKTNTKLVTMLSAVLFNMSLQTKLNSKTSYFISSDLISFWITSMTIMMLFILMMMKQKNMKMYKTTTTAMMMILLVTFNSWNFMMFYLMFEMSMVIILMIIISWGYQPERTEAIMFMIIMTLMFSLPFMAALMSDKKNLNFWFMNMNLHLMTFISFMLIFMMKMPIYFTHFWLPKVHVEAPVHGSMILAAIMLKLGCYGMIRMNKTIMKFNSLKPLIFSASLISMIILSMNCIIQTDLKTLIAYSSIVHMSMVFMNILMLKDKSILSSMMIIIGHGLCAATLFLVANIMYENSKSRSMLMNKGILNLMPAMMILWFTACMNNAPMPPSMNMMGELISFKNLISWSPLTLMMIIIVSMTSSMYSIYLFCSPAHGKFSKMIVKKKVLLTNHSMITTAMMVPITMITAKPAMLMM